MRLNDLIDRANKLFIEDALSWQWDHERERPVELAEGEDVFAQLVARVLAGAFDPTAPDAVQIAIAQRALRKVATDLVRIAGGLSKSYEELTKEWYAQNKILPEKSDEEFKREIMALHDVMEASETL